MSTTFEPNGFLLDKLPAESGDAEQDYRQLLELYDESRRPRGEGEIVPGRVVAVTSSAVLVDIGYPSEGRVPIEEFTDSQGNLTVEVGDEVEVLLEETADLEGHLLLSWAKVQRMRRWAEVERAYEEGKILKGRVTQRIKGGLAVDVFGFRAFLPGSLVEIRQTKPIETLCGQELEFKIINLKRRRNNLVLSRKAALEIQLQKRRAETLARLEEGALWRGVVKNLVDYGVFIDLGGIDGLLHVSNISWGRVGHPSEHFSVGEEVEVVLLRIDPVTQRIDLGYKQKSDDPWRLVDEKYPIGARVRGRVVSVLGDGALVDLEEGFEGFIHVSEMSWTRKVADPVKVLAVSDEIEAIVSELHMDKRRVGLSLRRTEPNPWEELQGTHPVGTIIEGKVRNLTKVGAFVEVTEEIDGLIHVSDMSWTRRVKLPNEVLEVGDTVRARITDIDVENQHVSLSIKEFVPNEWEDFAREHKVGDLLEGRVVNVTDFGLFIDIYNGLEGLAHVSEIEAGEGVRPKDRYSVGDRVRTRILRIEEDEKRVGLSMRGVPQPPEPAVAAGRLPGRTSL